MASALSVGEVPAPLPVAGSWQLAGWRLQAVPSSVIAGLEAAGAQALRLELREVDSGGALTGYVLLVEKAGLRWRIMLTVRPSGEDWRARAADDAFAALVLTRLRVG